MRQRFRRRGRPPHPDILTPAEWRVLEEVRRGRTNPEIATALGLSPNTVKTHVSRMMEKLDISDRRQLAAWKGEPAPATTTTRRSSLLAPLGWVSAKTAGIAAATIVVAVLAAFSVSLGLNNATTGVPTDLATPPPLLSTSPEPTPTPSPAGPSFRSLQWTPLAPNASTATRLPDGRVLIAGGRTYTDNGYEHVEDAILYDPVSDTIKVIPGLNEPRWAHGATLLDDGRVLITGGIAMDDAGMQRSSVVTSAELYDPLSETFRSLPPMTMARATHGTVLLADGRVLLAGGVSNNESGGPSDPSQEKTASMELFDPIAEAFVAVGAMTAARSTVHLISLASGSVLIAGDDAPMEILDPSDGSSRALPILEGWTGSTATLLPNGLVLVVGGVPPDGDGSATDSVVLVDPASEQVVSHGSLLDARFGHAAVLLTDGRVLVVGGVSHVMEEGFVRSSELFDPSTMTSTSTASMSAPQVSSQAVLLADGSVLVLGGAVTGAAAPPERYQP